MKLIFTSIINYTLLVGVIRDPVGAVAQASLRQTGSDATEFIASTESRSQRKLQLQGSSVAHQLFGGITTTVDCVDFPENWHDDTGPWYDCPWYRDNACNEGDLHENDGYTANEACCACGGGQRTTTPAPTPSPTSSPTKKSVGSEGAECVNEPPDWYDSFGAWYDCGWYKEHGCEESDQHRDDRYGLTASEACCVCGGGIQACRDPSYVYMPVTKSWEEHDITAKRQGCEMASIHSAAEAGIIAQVAEYNGVWIGGQKKPGAPDGCKDAQCWEWTDGTPWGYLNWRAGEPNNRAGGEDRVYMYSDTTLNDYTRRGKAHAVYKCCKK